MRLGCEDQGVKKPGDEDIGVEKTGGEDIGVKKTGGDDQGVKKSDEEEPVAKKSAVKKKAIRNQTSKKPAVKKTAIKKQAIKKKKIKPLTKSFFMADQTLSKVTSISGIPMTAITVGGLKETPPVHATSLKSQQANNKESTVINLTSSPYRSDSITSITSASSIEQEESNQKSGSPPLTPRPESPAQQSPPFQPSPSQSPAQQSPPSQSPPSKPSPSQPTERRRLLLARQAVNELQLDR